MLSKGQILKARKAMERFYDGTCTITERQPYKRQNGSIGFRTVDVVDVYKRQIPVMSHSLKKKLMAAFRMYQELDEETGDTYMIYEYWTDTACQAFRRKIGDTVDEGLFYCNMFVDPQTEERFSEYRHDLGEVPFIPFPNNNKMCIRDRTGTGQLILTGSYRMPTWPRSLMGITISSSVLKAPNHRARTNSIISRSGIMKMCIRDSCSKEDPGRN